MTRYGPETYGERIADCYDELYPDPPTAAIDVLADLAGAGPALELGIGSGRFALPLARRGVDVRGVDASRAMVDLLRSKPGGETIPVEISDFARFELDASFSLVYVVFNTFFGLLTQEDQVRCFECVAKHLAPGGRFLIEAFVPDQGRFDRGQRVSVSRVDDDEIQLEATMHDPVRQISDSRHVVISEQGVRLYPVRIRYAWPAELDLMARLAGLRFHQRWGGWEGQPFDRRAETHVSVWERPPAAG